MAGVHGRWRLRDADALADGWLCRGRPGTMAGARPLAPDRRRMAGHDAGRAAAGDCRPRRSAMSAITRPTRSLAGAASICRPRWSGKSLPVPAISTMPSAWCGNGPAAPTPPIPATARRGRARRIQRQVHGQPAGAARLLACNACRTQPHHLSQLLLSAPSLAIQRDCASPTTPPDYFEIQPRRDARSGEYHECARRCPCRCASSRPTNHCVCPRRDRRFVAAPQAAVAEIFL